MENKQIFPDAVKSAWENRKPEVVFTTVAKDSVSNSIYATCVSCFDGNKIIVANNFFDKTISNIKSGSKGTILFITKDEKPKAFQIKGSIEYVTEGAAFDDMKTWNPEHLPGHGVAIVTAEEIYSGSEKLL